MAAEHDFELLDDYLANRLGEQEKSAFEEKLDKDPELKRELELQQQFINGIKKARVAELKAMMNKIPVPAAPSTGAAIGGKIAVWAVVAAVVGTALYLYFDKDQVATVTPSADSAIQTQPEVLNEQEQPETESPAETFKSKEESPEVSETQPSSEQQPAESPKAPKKSQPGEGKVSNEPKIDVFDPSTEAEDIRSITDDINSDVLKENQSSSIAVEIDSQNKKYNFHYQFKEGRLMLYGPFEKNLYEIMEFFSDDKRTLFLFYKDDYYLLKDDNQKLKPLDPIQDPILIRKLKDYRIN